jgi:hypothetical protein
MAQNHNTVTVTGCYSEPSLKVAKTFASDELVTKVIADTGKELQSSLSSKYRMDFILEQDLRCVGTSPTTSTHSPILHLTPISDALVLGKSDGDMPISSFPDLSMTFERCSSGPESKFPPSIHSAFKESQKSFQDLVRELKKELKKEIAEERAARVVSVTKEYSVNTDKVTNFIFRLEKEHDKLEKKHDKLEKEHDKLEKEHKELKSDYHASAEHGIEVRQYPSDLSLH